MKYRNYFLVILLIGICRIGVSAQAADDAKHVQVELISEAETVRPGEDFWVALRLKIAPGWHIYWKNPGDSGLSTTVEWDLPDGVEAGELKWPYPQKIDEPPLTAYGYMDEVTFLSKMSISDNINMQKSLEIKAKVEWLACKEICINEKAYAVLSIDSSEEPLRRDFKCKELFSKARSVIPVIGSKLEIYSTQDENHIILKLTGQQSIRDALFFSEDPMVVKHSSEQKILNTEEGYELVIEKSNLLEEKLEKLKGVLVYNSSGTREAVCISQNIYQDTYAIDGASDVNIWIAILFAFIGGLILNLMPCVLPVLSLKILSFIEQAKENESKAWIHGAFYTVGVLASFLVMAGFIILVRSGGEKIGWGFQLQSPEFLIFLSVVFMFFTLNLFGVFEITGLPFFLRIASNRYGRWQGSFMSGVLAVVVATPCTAPFMGTALGFALSQKVFISLAIFFFLGLGMAIPYFLLSLNPSFLRFIPKPGKWMRILKFVMGILLMLTVIWILWILYLQTSTGVILSVFLGLLFITIISLFLGSRSGHGGLNVAGRIIMAIIPIVTIGFFIVVNSMIHKIKADSTGIFKKEKTEINWLKYSPSLMAELKESDSPVFVNFTAAWCISCQVNDKVSINSPSVIKKIKELGVIMVKADWTAKDTIIAQGLESYGRNSIPLYVLYGSDKNKPPVILPELLTPDILLSAFRKAEE